MPINLHNTLSGKVEELQPLDPSEVRMYVCGLTVYGRGHIGNYRTFVATDLLRRTLRYKGYRVKHVMNITDVDDRIIAFAKEANQDLESFTAEHIRSFDEDMKTLKIERPDIVPKATDHIADMVGLISRLDERGHTYKADDSIYFRISSFPEYGKLSRLDVSGIKPGARVDTDKYDKENPRDFALWKSKRDEPEWAQWDAPFGKGRPGWHVECSAMSMKYLGETFDLHCGGIDLIFPHHENEIAQSSGGTGKPFVKHWMHVAHLLVEDQTMSKSKGNYVTLPDVLEQGHKPDAIRYLYLTAHYRKQMSFSWDALQKAVAALQRIHGFVERLAEVSKEGTLSPAVEKACQEAEKQFEAALSDDLNTPEALAAVHNLVTHGNSLLASGEVNSAGAAKLRTQIEAMNDVFGVLLPEGADTLTSDEQKLFDERQESRKNREFAKADAARKRLEELGIILEDTPKGTRWRRKR